MYLNHSSYHYLQYVPCRVLACDFKTNIFVIVTMVVSVVAVVLCVSYWYVD